MNKNCFHILYSIIICGLVALLYYTYNHNKKIELVQKSVTDTLFFTRIDTIREYKKEYVEKRIIDTIYLKANEELYLPIEQKKYSNPQVYDLWVSGYQPTLDSIFVYPKTEYKTITTTITKEIEYSSWNLYTYMGINSLNNNTLPCIGLMAKSPKHSIYMAEIGLYNGNMVFGVNIGYKLK